jgi:hypothetical protein
MAETFIIGVAGEISLHILMLHVHHEWLEALTTGHT